MDLWRLHIFCKVIELKSFSRAAKAVYLSQPTISSHIKELESYLECKLVDRLGREVVPTKAGSLLYHYATRIIALKQEAENALADFQGKIKGRLTIGGSTIPGGYILPPLLGKFKKDYPEVMVTLIQGDTERIIKDTLEGNVELGIVGAKARGVQLIQQKIIDDEMFLIVPPAHNWAARRHIVMKELITEPFIMRELGSGTRKSIEQVLDKAGHALSALNVVAEMGSTEAIRQGIKAGVGVSILSECAVAEELAAGSLKKVTIKGLSFKRAFYLTVHRDRTQSPLCRAFIKFLERQTQRHE
ncbi:MAG: LysR family transcriptional regulator [Deltaproteobacteria bacterium]|nr:LysR family transcriptional regulator [Deltaproteobacteria bacterium]MBW2019389.1 LysR family transcriptional regulator [Deltaproteobacteria bacterium]MBW2074226.1 LysR family transcriptional regulator [Deltaproteobacteria bacterium]RLB84049.1 MAG: LysR family transcriptional regulator [Deltaproteobacteria bacterium]